MRAIDADELKIGISGRPWEWNRVEICKFIDKQSTIEPEPKTCEGCKHERHGSVVCDDCSRFFLDRYEVDKNG